MGASTRILIAMKRIGIVLILLLAFCGIANAAYIAKNESSGTPLLCNLENLSGCNIVVASPYSSFLGISVAEYGVVFYSIIFILAALELFLLSVFVRRLIQGLSLLGVIASACFVLLQIFVIKAFCIYCTISALISLLIFVCASMLEPLPENIRRVVSRKTKSSPSLPMPPAP